MLLLLIGITPSLGFWNYSVCCLYTMLAAQGPLLSALGNCFLIVPFFDTLVSQTS